MKIATSLLIAFVLCVFSYTLSASDGLKLSSIPDKNHTFILKHVNDSAEDGIKGKIMITVGVEFNSWGSALQKKYLSSRNYSFIGNIESHPASPMFYAMVDYGFSKKISFGIAFGYQTAKIKLKDIDNTEDKYFDSWQRVHLAARGDYFIISKENLNLYTGIKIGYNIYRVTSNVPESIYPGYLKNLDVYPSEGTFQAHLGFCYYIKMIGLNAEIGLGYDLQYLCAVGIKIKI